MNYKDFHNEKLSQLGFGLMRLPVIDNDQSKVDIPKVDEMVMCAYNSGVNYFDTAFPYHNGFSEAALGTILENNKIRDKVNIATKLFTLGIEKPDFSPEKMFATQLERLKTDHIDFYLVHGLQASKWNTLKENHDIVNFLNKLKAEKKVRYLGFSFHDNFEAFKTIIDDFDWDFCQIQYNYLDHNIQAGDEGLKYAHEKNVPVMIMEPLKGGNLIFPNYPQIDAIKEKHGLSAMSNAELGLRYVYDKVGVCVVLSGMSEMAQLKENIEIAGRCQTGCFTAEEQACVDDLTAFLESVETIPCTSCRYCTEGCPEKIAIPMAFSLYNGAMKFGNKEAQMRNYNRSLTNIGDCVECGQCAEACPQHLDIPVLLKKVKEFFEG